MRLTERVLKLSSDEKETHIYQNASDRSQWIIFTDDLIRAKEFKVKGLKLLKRVGKGYEFALPDNQLTIRKKRKNAKTNPNTLSSKKTSDN